MQILSFNECIDKCNDNKKPHLLLGNGFSIACRPNIFSYNNLFTQSYPKFTDTLKQAFEILGTKDFEMVIKSLNSAVQLYDVYSEGDIRKENILKDSQLLKSILVQSIASSHPENPSDIEESEYVNCRIFLNHFADIYTLNYDLLLYWASMHDEYASNVKLKHDDGFRTPDYGKQEYVHWNVENTDQQNIFYLHGALHLFDAGEHLLKYTWINTGLRLIEQIRAALEKDSYPLFVSEGTSTEKREKIYHSGYLIRCYRSFAKIGGNLFIYGHSLADNDDHILNLIYRSKIKNLFISMFGDPNSQNNKELILKAQNLVEKRKEVNSKKLKNKVELSIHFFDATTALIWH